MRWIEILIIKTRGGVKNTSHFCAGSISGSFSSAAVSTRERTSTSAKKLMLDGVPGAVKGLK